MVTPENPKQADYYGVPSQFNKGIFSSDPKQEKDLAEYFAWLTNNFQNLTGKQRYDFEALQLKQNLYTIKNKNFSELNNREKEFLRKYNVQYKAGPGYLPGSMAEPKIITDKSQLPKIASSSQGTTGSIEKVNVPGAAKDLYKYTNYQTKQTEYYYVLKDVKKFNQTSMDTDKLLSRYQNISEILQKDPRSGTGTGFQFPSVTRTGTKTTPAKYAKLWYSDDYKKLYADEIRRISLQLLQMPDLVLSQFDWETIDFVPDYTGTVIRENGEVIQTTYAEPQETIRSTVNPIIANTIFRIQNNTFAPVIKAVSPLRSGYTKYLQNFGHHRNRSSEMREYFPGYKANGNPYYDIEIDFEDMPEVNSYTIYLVEEDGII